MSDLNAAWDDFEKSTEEKPATEAKPEGDAETTAAIPEGEAAATGEQPAAEEKPRAEQPRDEKGKFMPVDRHKQILDKAYAESANERALREAAEAKVAELTKPSQYTDEEFEGAIEDLPEALQAYMRHQRSILGKTTEELQAEKKARAQSEAAQKAQATQMEHQAALATAPQLAEAYANPAKRAAIDAISDSLMADPDYVFVDRPSHYAAVQEKYAEVFPPAAPPQKQLPTKKSVPESLSAIPSATQPTISKPPPTDFTSALAATKGMSDEQAMRLILGG